MIKQDNDTYIVKDSTIQNGGDRIPNETNHKTIWEKNGNLISYYEQHVNSILGKMDWHEISPEKRERMHKIAITRHKKMLYTKLGWMKKSTSKKIIHFSRTVGEFYVRNAVEKDKIYVTDTGRENKKDCVEWTQQKQELIDEYHQVKKEYKNKLNNLMNKIFDKEE